MSGSSPRQTELSWDAHVERSNRIADVVDKAIQLISAEGSFSLSHKDSKESNARLAPPQTCTADFFSIDQFQRRLQSLIDAFPPLKDSSYVPKAQDWHPAQSYSLHTFAVKSNPIFSVLQIAERMGLGAECASYGELKHALRAGFTPNRILLDSPCKSKSEVLLILQTGCRMNLDNELEIAYVQEILSSKSAEFLADPQQAAQPLPSSSLEQLLLSHPRIGVRINPVIGAGKIADLSTATASSKFGIPLTEETKESLVELFAKHPWLQGLHVHVGSQGCAIQQLVDGVKKVTDFAEHLNATLGRRQIKVIDIGGGVPTSYDSDKEAYEYQEYRELLEKQVPELFSGGYCIITEFGRSLSTKSCFTLTKVEAVKITADNHRIAVAHVGGNQFVRETLVPGIWQHRISVFDGKTRKPKSSLDTKREIVCQSIAGPLCFSGDFVAKKVDIPRIDAGDYIVVHDTGGYCMAMYSRFVSRPSSPVFGYTGGINEGADAGRNMEFFLWKEEESLDDVLRFWGSTAASKVLEV